MPFASSVCVCLLIDFDQSASTTNIGLTRTYSSLLPIRHTKQRARLSHHSTQHLPLRPITHASLADDDAAAAPAPAAGRGPPAPRPGRAGLCAQRRRQDRRGPESGESIHRAAGFVNPSTRPTHRSIRSIGRSHHARQPPHPPDAPPHNQPVHAASQRRIGTTTTMMAKHDLVDFGDLDLDGSNCRIGIVKARVGVPMYIYSTRDHAFCGTHRKTIVRMDPLALFQSIHQSQSPTQQ